MWYDREEEENRAKLYLDYSPSRNCTRCAHFGNGRCTLLPSLHFDTDEHHVCGRFVLIEKVIEA